MPATPITTVPFNSVDMDAIKKLRDNLTEKINKLQGLGLPGVKDIPNAVWTMIQGQLLLSPRQISKKLLMIQGSKFQKGDNTSFIKPITEEDAQLMVYGKVYYQDGKLYDKDYNTSAWVYYKDSNYDDSSISCIAHPSEEDYFPPINTENPMFQKAIAIVKELKEGLLQLGIKLGEFLVALPSTIATIVVSLVALVSSLIILPIGAGIPPALTAVQTMIAAIKELQAKSAAFLPLLKILEIMGLIMPKAGQVIIAQIQAIFEIILGIISALLSILGLLDAVMKLLGLAKKAMDEQTMEAEPRANDPNLESGESTKLDAGPSGGNWNYNYEWTDDQGNIVSTEKSPTVTPGKTTTYTVKITDKTSGEVKENDVKIKVRPGPESTGTETKTTTKTTTIKKTSSGLGPGSSIGSGFPVSTTTTTQTPYCYGLLYNWYTIDDGRGIAPTGWHVPTKTDYDTLTTQLGGYSVAGGHLKETGITYWIAQSAGCDNSSGFNGRGSGILGIISPTGFTNLTRSAYFWSSTADAPGYAWAADLNYFSDAGGMQPSTYLTKDGLSVRLVKDNNIDTGTMIDYDSNIYSTVTIGTQVWATTNLYVTHYNNGNIIPEVTNLITWSGLTSGALCSYNNNWSYSCTAQPTTTTTTTAGTTTTTTTAATTTTTTTFTYFYNISRYTCTNCGLPPEYLTVSSNTYYATGTGDYYLWSTSPIQIISTDITGPDGDISTLTGPYASCVIACAS